MLCVEKGDHSCFSCLQHWKSGNDLGMRLYCLYACTQHLNLILCYSVMCYNNSTMLQLHLRLKTCQLMSFPATSTWRRLPWRRDSTYLALAAVYLATCTDGNTGRGIHTQRMKIWPKIWISCLALCFMMIWPHWSQKMLLSSWHTVDQSKAVEYDKPSISS